MVSPASHVDVATSKAVKAASGQLVAVVLTPGTAAATLTVYDNPSAASGTVLVALAAVANGASVEFAPAIPYVFTTGCYASISGTAANATVVIL